MAFLRRPPGLLLRLRSVDSGMTLIEICIACMIMSIALIGVVGSMGAGLSLVGQGRQRSSAPEVAQQAIERVHDVAFAQVALSAQPTQSLDASNPDYYATAYTYEPDGTGSQAA